MKRLARLRAEAALTSIGTQKTNAAGTNAEPGWF